MNGMTFRAPPCTTKIQNRILEKYTECDATQNCLK